MPMEDPAGGPNASMGFGDASQFAQERQAVASTSGGPPPGPPQGGAPPQQPPQPGQPQQGGPVQPGAPPPQQGQQQQQPQGQGRLDLNSVFPPMPEIDQMDKAPWRQQLRTWASHPNAGPALRKLADLIDQQHGPQY